MIPTPITNALDETLHLILQKELEDISIENIDKLKTRILDRVKMLEKIKNRKQSKIILDGLRKILVNDDIDKLTKSFNNIIITTKDNSVNGT